MKLDEVLSIWREKQLLQLYHDLARARKITWSSPVIISGVATPGPTGHRAYRAQALVKLKGSEPEWSKLNFHLKSTKANFRLIGHFIVAFHTSLTTMEC